MWPDKIYANILGLALQLGTSLPRAHNRRTRHRGRWGWKRQRQLTACSGGGELAPNDPTSAKFSRKGCLREKMGTQIPPH